jgi:(S)-2-hydroxy-acid oxidase
VTEKLVRRAESAGFSALVLTVDAPMFGRRLADIRNRFSLPAHLGMANFSEMGELEKRAGKKEEGKSGINEYVASLFDPTLQWKDVEWLKSKTRLPIILKGILRADDAVKVRSRS